MQVVAENDRIDDLENLYKRNNVFIWGVLEGIEEDFVSMEEFIEVELLQRHLEVREKRQTDADAQK